MSDAAALAIVHTQAYDLSDEVLSRIEAFRAAGTASEDWLLRSGKAVSIGKITMRRVERRFIELGLEPPVTRDGYERDTIRRLKGQLRQLQAEIAKREGGEQ